MKWEENLKCKNCGNELDLFNYGNSIVCSHCKKKYEIITNEISYAVAESGSCDYYKFKEDNTICRRSFMNPPKDTLEEAYQDTIALLNINENNPQLLLDIVKKYHDSLKMRVRRLIELNSGNLTPHQKAKVLVDNIKNPEKSLNIKNLFYYLKCAFPNKQAVINSCHKKNETMIKRIWWVRNKIEHVLYTQWPLNAKIFEDPIYNPNDSAQAPDNLNYDFVRRTNNTVIDVYKLVLSLKSTPHNKQELGVLEFYKM